jgi:signal transduction histidine kinase
MIYLKLRQAGHIVNHKRVDRLYAEAGLQVKGRRRKKVRQSERQPLGRPARANQVWSMDFVFDRTAEGRAIKCLTVRPSAKFDLSGMNKLIFKDTGKGIAKEIIPNLFEPFFSRRHHGTGIGLAFCARIMEAHGGTISCDSIEGEYVTFEMTFPDNFERKK